MGLKIQNPIISDSLDILSKLSGVKLYPRLVKLYPVSACITQWFLNWAPPSPRDSMNQPPLFPYHTLMVGRTTYPPISIHPEFSIMTINIKLPLKISFHSLKHTQGCETPMSFGARILSLPFSLELCYDSAIIEILCMIYHVSGSQFPICKIKKTVTFRQHWVRQKRRNQHEIVLWTGESYTHVKRYVTRVHLRTHTTTSLAPLS